MAATAMVLAKEHRPQPDVRELRLTLGMSQPEFAFKFGFNLGTLRQWEQGRTQPDRAARVLLMVIKHHPEIVLRAIEGNCGPVRV